MRPFGLMLMVVGLILAVITLGLCSIPLPEEAPGASVEVASAAPSETSGPSLAQTVWTFVNSPGGLTLIASIIAFVMGRVYLAKPKWKVLMDQYRPKLMAAIKFAEKKIPDNAKNKSLARLNEAFLYAINLDDKLLSVAKKADIKDALTALHSEAEKEGNL